MPVSKLKTQSCVPCKKGQPPLSASEAKALLQQLNGWQLTRNRKGITKTLNMKDFSAAIAFFQRVADVANAEDHHPDLHLTGYRNVAIELTTHAIKGLSENDFILAAKIDELPVELKKKS